MAKRFGLEVEFEGDMQAVIDELRREGLSVRDNRHSHLGYADTGWTVKRDGSVSRGGEMVSPPLDFTNDAEREQVTRAVLCLQRAGATTTPSAGIHVHVEAKHEDGTEMTGKEIAAVVRFTYKFEDAIYRIASSGWQTIRAGARTYAQPIPEETAKAIMSVKTTEELHNVWNGRVLTGTRRRTRAGAPVDPYISRSYNRSYANTVRALDRYTATNLQSLQRHGTIEFRYFNSSVNPVRIQTYIALCIAIVDDARAGFSRSVKKSYRVGAMARGEVSEKALLLRLQQILRTESKDTKVLMSKEDWKNLRTLCWAGSKAQTDIWRSQQRWSN